jgi:hypothetical protein
MLEVIQHPVGLWGMRREDGKILVKRELMVGLRPRMRPIAVETWFEAEQLCRALEPLTTGQRNAHDVY